MPITIFICSAHKDKALLNELISHLMPLQRKGLIEISHDHDIPAGTAWEAKVMQGINTAQIVLLLVSPDFLNSDSSYHIEIKLAIARHERGEARVIPIILRPVFWQEMPFGKLQALPTDGVPVTSPFWADRDAAFYDIVLGISQVVKRIAPPSAPLPPSPRPLLRVLCSISSCKKRPRDYLVLPHQKITRFLKRGVRPEGTNNHTFVRWTGPLLLIVAMLGLIGVLLISSALEEKKK